MMEARIVTESPFFSKPIVSYGLMVCSMDTKRWLVVRRRHSAEFVIIMRGMYRPSHLASLIEEITEEESLSMSDIFRGKISFEDLYISMKLCESELMHAKAMWIISGELIENLLRNVDTSGNSLQWSWPKGRINVIVGCNGPLFESSLDCAKREFEEEVEIKIPPSIYPPRLCANSVTKLISGKVLKSKFFLYVIEKEFPLSGTIDNIEVSDRRWVERDEIETYLPSFTGMKDIDEIMR